MKFATQFFSTCLIQEKIGKGKIYQIKIGKDRFVCKISISNTDGCLELESFLPFSSLGYVVYVFAHKSQPYLHSEPFTLCIKISVILYILKVSSFQKDFLVSSILPKKLTKNQKNLTKHYILHDTPGFFLKN